MPESVTAYFSPHGGCTAAWVREIEATQRTFLVAAYAFTSPEIAQALIAIRQAGKDIQIICCPTMAWGHGSQVGVVAAAGVPTFIDPMHRIFHNKFGVRDDQVVLEGSFNLTTSAEKFNAENLVVVRIAEFARQYRANFLVHLGHSVPYTPEPPAHHLACMPGMPDEDGAFAEGDGPPLVW